ncbi:hypothetical protein CHELA20_53952 [Hyphomicrobiales bacterium]|nr:hypothetical protein CHELA41_20975 [Hyphomicrobiales bacterium]CAH1685292.1 hypothetical protein CHELA20_53952 [Hyphomicrobiales bacterium]
MLVDVERRAERGHCREALFRISLGVGRAHAFGSRGARVVFWIVVDGGKFRRLLIGLDVKAARIPMT